jgi:hypothetical protein
MALPDQRINTGLFRPSTTALDVSRISEVEVTSPEFKELLVRLYQTVNNIDIDLNLKDSAMYFLEEFVSGQLWFNPSDTDPNNQRQAFRRVIDFGALPAAGSKSVAHGITISLPTTFVWTRIYGAATNPTTAQGLPIPYSSAAAVANNLELTVNDTVVTITTGGVDYSAFTKCVVVLEYVKF